MTESELEAAFAAAASLALAVPSLVSPDPQTTLRTMVAHLDARIAAQLGAIVSHPPLRALQSAWLGVRHLCHHVDGKAVAACRVLDIDRTELEAAVSPPGLPERSRLSELLCDRVYSEPGAPPVAVLVMDLELDHCDADVKLLGALSRIAARCQTVMIGGAAPGLLGLKDFSGPLAFQEVEPLFERPDYAPWQRLQADPDSRYLGLILPRLQLGSARMPGGEAAPARTMNMAFAVAANIARSVTRWGWPVRFVGGEEGGISVPAAPSGDEPATEFEPSTSLAVSDRLEATLAGVGLNAARNPTDGRVSVSAAQSLYTPWRFTEAEDPDDRIIERCTAKFSNLVFFCRFAQGAMRVAADCAAGRGADCEAAIGAFLARYTKAQPATYSEEELSNQPLHLGEFRLLDATTGVGELSAWPTYGPKGLPRPVRLKVILPPGRRTD